MEFKVYKEKKGTGEKVYYSCGSYYNAQQVYDFIQENDNKNNDFFVWITQE